MTRFEFSRTDRGRTGRDGRYGSRSRGRSGSSRQVRSVSAEDEDGVPAARPQRSARGKGKVENAREEVSYKDLYEALLREMEKDGVRCDWTGFGSCDESCDGEGSIVSDHPLPTEIVIRERVHEESIVDLPLSKETVVPNEILMLPPPRTSPSRRARRSRSSDRRSKNLGEEPLLDAEREAHALISRPSSRGRRKSPPGPQAIPDGMLMLPPSRSSHRRSKNVGDDSLLDAGREAYALISRSRSRGWSKSLLAIRDGTVRMPAPRSSPGRATGNSRRSRGRSKSLGDDPLLDVEREVYSLSRPRSRRRSKSPRAHLLAAEAVGCDLIPRSNGKVAHPLSSRSSSCGRSKSTQAHPLTTGAMGFPLVPRPNSRSHRRSGSSSLSRSVSRSVSRLKKRPSAEHTLEDDESEGRRERISKSTVRKEGLFGKMKRAAVMVKNKCLPVGEHTYKLGEKARCKLSNRKVPKSFSSCVDLETCTVEGESLLFND